MDTTFHRGLKYRIYPNDAQIRLIRQTTGSCRYVRNYFLDYHKTAYEERSETVRYKDTSALLTVLKKADDHKWLKLSDSMALQEALKDLDIGYKAEEYGCIVQKVPRFYASSQTCSECGRKNKAVKNLKIRKWICPHCGAEHGRDVNAAVNIRNMAVELVSG